MADLLDYALTTVSDVKETLSIPSSDHTKDNIITRKINQATEMIEKYTGRRFKLTTYTNEEYDGTGVDQLVLKNRPVVSFTSLGTRDTSLNEDDWENTDTELYFVDNAAGVIDLNFSAGGRWNRLRATYTAGYTTIPADVAEAAATLAAYLTENGTSGAAIKAKSEGQRRVEYYDTRNGSGNGNLFDQLNIKEALQPYMNYPINADI